MLNQHSISNARHSGNFDNTKLFEMIFYIIETNNENEVGPCILNMSAVDAL